MSKRILLALAGVCVLSWLLCPAASQAAPLEVTAKFKSVSPGVLIDFTVRDATGQPANLPKQTTIAGMFNWQTVTTNAGFAPTFISFCIEINQYISSNGTYTYQVVDLESAPNPGKGTGGPGVNGPMTGTEADRIRQLWGMHFADVVDKVTAAAFQLAIWEIIYGPHFTAFANTSSSTVQADGVAAINLANQWVSNVQTLDPSKFNNYLVVISNGTNQDEVTILTPAPSSLLLAGLGLMGLVGYVRKQRRPPLLAVA